MIKERLATWLAEKRLPKVQDHLPDDAPVIVPAADSAYGHSVPALVTLHGKLWRFALNAPRIMPLMARAMRAIKVSYGSLCVLPVQPKTAAPPELAHEIVDLAMSLGCSQVGFTHVPRRLIFSNKVILYPNAIVLTMEMDKAEIEKAPGIATGQEVWRTYSRLGEIVNEIARFLRARGYGAQAGPALGGEVNYPLLAQKAGLGQIGTHGLLISPGSGPSQRISAVYTSINNLPATDSNAHAWIADFCETCGHCVRACPGQAIYERPLVRKDGSEQHIDYKRCALPFSETMGCSVCIKACTFFKGDYGRIKARFVAKLRNVAPPCA